MKSKDHAINDFYEDLRKKVEIAKWIIKTIKPLDELLNSILSPFGVLPQCFTSLYQMYQIMQGFHEEMKLENIASQLKKPHTKNSLKLHHLAWGKLPSLTPQESVNAFESHLQVILSAREWINVQLTITQISDYLSQFLSNDNEKDINNAQITFHGHNNTIVSKIQTEMTVYLDRIMKSFHYYTNKALSEEIPLELLEKVHGNVILLIKFLQSFEDFIILFDTLRPQLQILFELEQEFRDKDDNIQSFLEIDTETDPNLSMSMLELSRRVNHTINDVKRFRMKANSIIHELRILNKLLDTLQKTTETHPLFDLVEEFLDENGSDMQRNEIN